VIKAFRSRGPLRNAKSRVGDVFVSVSRSKHCSTKKTPVKKRESQKKTANKTRRDPFFSSFFLEKKNSKMVQMQAYCQFWGHLLAGVEKQSSIPILPISLLPNSVVDQRQPGLFLDDIKTPE
jgi:hypothetical protein